MTAKKDKGKDKSKKHEHQHNHEHKEKKEKPTDSKKKDKSKKAKAEKSAEDDVPALLDALVETGTKEAEVVVIPPLTGPEEKRLYSKRIRLALLPIQFFAMLSGHWPFVCKENLENGSFKFKYSPISIRGAWFFFMLFLSFFTCITTAINYMYVSMDLEVLPGENTPVFREERWYEITLFKREVIWQMSMSAAMVQSCFATFHIFAKREYMASIYTFYTRIVQQLHMDISEGAFTNGLKLITIYLCTTFAIMLIGILRVAPVTTGSPTLFGVFVFRQFAEWKGLWITEPTDTRTAIRILGAVTMILIMNSGKVQIFAFVYHCKLLRNAFATWNGRVYVTIVKGGKFMATEEGRLALNLLYKDHCVLLDMLEGMNRCFSTVIESYFACQIFAIFLELYFFLRAGGYGDQQTQGAVGGGTFFIRPQDYIPGGLLLAQSCIIFYIACQAGTSVGEEAKVGVDIMRRKSMINRKTDTMLLFQLSMDGSYNAFSRLDVSGGGYSYIDKEWLMGMGNNLASYFIIMYQFAPTLDRKTPGDWERRRVVGNFLTSVEYFIDPMHWQSTPPPPRSVYPYTG